MAEAEKTTFQVGCLHCEKSFHVRYALQDPGAEGTAEVMVECPYCAGKLVVRLERKFVEEVGAFRAATGVRGG